MSDLSFDLPAYDEAIANLHDKVIFGFVSLNPLYGVNHLDQMMEPVSVTNTTDIEAYADIVSKPSPLR